jgi:hypothetical protein
MPKTFRFRQVCWLVLISPLMLTGCISQYRVPYGAPAASLRLLTNTDENTTFSVADPSRCPKPPRPQLLAGTGRQIAAMGKEPGLGLAGASPQPPARTRERRVEAGKRFYISVISADAESEARVRCAVGVSFVPEAGGEYEIRYQRDETASQCSAQVVRLRPLAAGGANVVAEPSQQGFRALKPEWICEK